MTPFSFNLITLVAAAFISGVTSQVGIGPYSQCGGIGWAGSTACTLELCCIIINPYYSFVQFEPR
ncbi:hypothetical protein FRB95_014214 [Tulasnella sp. JGI-2019a]|nr:hypothetical protein FRB93_012152 [Tulasnella sp. JGI-2019a]KAG9033793.1 hypothetical protein FRB95_014214 [Tulasnella sp. JGI-2019a]